MARVAWRLSAAARCARLPDQQQRLVELQWALADTAQVEKLEQQVGGYPGGGSFTSAAGLCAHACRHCLLPGPVTPCPPTPPPQVQPCDLIEEAQVLHTAFSLPNWRGGAAWLPTLAPVAAAAPGEAAQAAGGATPGTIEVRTRHWLGELMSWEAGAASSDPQRSPPAPGLASFSAGAAREAAACLMALFPEASPAVGLESEASAASSLPGGSSSCGPGLAQEAAGCGERVDPAAGAPAFEFG